LSVGPETENLRTDPFQIQGDTIRLSGTVRSTDPGVFPLLQIFPKAESGGPVGDFFQTTDPGRFDHNILAHPGTYSLEIHTGGGEEYSLTVEDCGSSPPGGSAPAGSPSPVANPSPNPSPSPSPGPSPSVPPIDSRPPRDLLDAGGPAGGPLPLMADGTCPREFPAKRDGACY
jgi:hypothetical protein